MAILQKRTSSKQLPGLRGRSPFTSVAFDARNKPSSGAFAPNRPNRPTVLDNLNTQPALTGGARPGAGTGPAINVGTKPAQNAVTRPVTSTITPSVTTRPTVRPPVTTTPTTKPVTTQPTTRPVTTKPTVTTKPVTTNPTVTTKPITTKPTVTTKPTITSTTTPAVTTKPTITSTTKPVVTTKPAVTTNTKPIVTPKPTITTPTSVVKPVVTPKTTSTTSKVMNAITGAALGAGAKVLIDKITGKPKVDNTAGGAKPGGAGGSSGTSGGTKNPAGGTKPAAGGATSKGPTSTIKSTHDSKSATDLYNGTPADPSLGLPEGAIDNGDGTYTVNGTTFDMQSGMPLFRDNPNGGIDLVTDNGDETYTIGNTTYSMKDDSVLFTTDADGKITVAQNSGNSQEGDGFGEGDGTPVENVTLADNGSNNEIVVDDTSNLDNVDTSDVVIPDYIAPVDNTDYSVADNTDYTDYTNEFAKRGGLITMMKNGGGIKGYADGAQVTSFDDYMSDPSLDNFKLPEGAVDNGDGTYTIGRYTYDMATDDYLYSSDDNGQITHVNPDATSSPTKAADEYTTDSRGNTFKNGVFYRAADVPDEYMQDSQGNVYKTMPDGTYEVVRTPDIPETITNVGDKAEKIATGNPLIGKEDPNVDPSFFDKIKSYLPAAGAGALIASLLGSDTGGGGLNQGVDMSQVGAINPRTTDFGIGPSNFVGYDQYGTEDGDYTPNEELLHNLNAPGYNPVNPGDYGYEQAPADVPAMASGGLSSMSTPVASYYTFGQPADIMANLGMRPQPPMNPPDMMPQIGQQGQMGQQKFPQQTPPQMSPPQMAQANQVAQGIENDPSKPMRKGGLSHVSNVPMTQGRMDFRQGAAVHGEGDGQSDDIPAMLADGEYVLDAELVAQIGNGSTKAGAQALDKFRENIRAHKRSAPINKIPPKTKVLTSYLKGAR